LRGLLCRCAFSFYLCLGWCLNPKFYIYFSIICQAFSLLEKRSLLFLHHGKKYLQPSFKWRKKEPGGFPGMKPIIMASFLVYDIYCKRWLGWYQNYGILGLHFPSLSHFPMLFFLQWWRWSIPQSFIIVSLWCLCLLRYG